MGHMDFVGFGAAGRDFNQSFGFRVSVGFRALGLGCIGLWIFRLQAKDK